MADIGASDAIVAGQGVALRENAPLLWLANFPWPPADVHKHKRGHVMVASGGKARTGAARLAARNALRIGAGLVTLLSPGEAMAENSAQLTAIMLREANDADGLASAAAEAQAMLIGPAFGVDASARAKLQGLMRGPGRCPLVLDADAITLLAPLGEGVVGARDVMTPHVGEFERAFPGLLKTSPTRIHATRAAAARAGCVMVLKGPDTIIAAPARRGDRQYWRQRLSGHRRVRRQLGGTDRWVDWPGHAQL